ncbi:DNA-binding protein RFX6-like [Amphiura filiformis]|uniref:DNA-binding protein RFX6-like n=1 Tax=Amphiura filiformis TaxID=82378 RepID=UPI003B22810F
MHDKKTEESGNKHVKGSLCIAQDEDTKENTQMSDSLKWLDENYERADGVCLPRCVLYTHYLDFCKKNNFVPAGAATFGKIVRQTFPNLTTRRLGTRGQSKYHYYGIGIKTTSVYYHSMYSGRGLSRFSENRIKNEIVSRKYSLSSKNGTLLPDFPSADSFVLSENVSREKLETFLMMYRTHCQRVLDTIVTSNFEEVQNFLLHFWQGMPKHMLPLLSCDFIVDIIVLCDNILYKVLVDVLIPSAIQDLPDALNADIRALTRKLPSWLKSSLENIPDKVQQRKLKAVKAFVRSLRRHTSFIHLAQTAKCVLLSHDSVSQMSSDLNDVTLPLAEKINGMLSEFAGLLNKQAPLQAYIEWIDSIIDRCVLQLSDDKPLEARAADFMLKWSFYTSKLVRDLTLHSAISFGSFHLLNMTLSEYTLLVLEGQQDDREHRQMECHVQKHMKQVAEISTKAKLRKGKSTIHAAPLDTCRTSKRKYNSTACTNSTETNAPQKRHSEQDIGHKQLRTTCNETSSYPISSSQYHHLQSTNPANERTTTSSAYQETPFGHSLGMYPREPQTEHVSPRFQHGPEQFTPSSADFPKRPIIATGLPPSYTMSHKPHFSQDRQDPPYYPYNFHSTYQAPLGGRNVYWGIEDAVQPSAYHETQLHNLSMNYHCDYGSALPHRAESSAPVSPYYRGSYEESSRQFYPGESPSFYGSRQYCGANSGVRYSTTIQPPQSSVEMFAPPRSSLPTTGNGFMEISNQSTSYEHAPHYGVQVRRDDCVSGGSYPGYYSPKSKSSVGPCY